MTHKAFNVILCLALLAGMVGFIPTSVVQAAEPEPETTTYPYATDHLIVKLRDEARVEKGTTSTHIASLDRALAEMNATALEAVPGLPATYLVKLDSKSADILGAVETLNNDPAVEYAEPDYLAKFASAPDDPRYSEQWGLAKVQAEGAWDETMGSPNVVIAIIDSGIDLAHEDLSPNLWLNPGEIAGNSLDDDNNGFVDDVQGWNFVNTTNDVQDFIGHGSLVAGVAAARSNNTLGIAGMCGNCRIMPVKITQVSGLANYSDIAAGVNYAADKGAKVINLSVGGYADSITVKNAINAALSKGIVVVGGVGNDNKSDKFYPAAYEGVIAVAGTDMADVRVTSSNYGAWVDISAPGQNILSTTLGDYSSDTGTSYATPFVSGAAGLLLSLHPEWTPAMVRSQFLHTTDPIDSLNPGYEGKLGSGRLNVALATQPSHPILTYKTYSGNGTPELRPDFGATVSLAVTLYNDWADAAGVTGTLSSTDTNVTITTAEVDFGSILAGTSQANSIPFSFDIAAGAGYNHAMPFSLALSADGGVYTTTLNFTITTRSSEEPVSGTIDVDTTWTNDKTYKVTGNVGVAPGYTLTIEPGTVVKFAGNYSLNLGGTLVAQGAAAQPIRFEPYTPSGTWNRIFLDDTSLDAVATTEGVYQSGNILQYVNISGATGGIACTTATPYLDHVTTDRGGLTCSLGETDLWMQDSTLTGTTSITGGGITPEHLAKIKILGGDATVPASQVAGSIFAGSLTVEGDGQVSNTTSGPLTINGAGDVQQAIVTGNITIASGQVLNTTVRGGSISSGDYSTISNCFIESGGIITGEESTITRNDIHGTPGWGITNGVAISTSYGSSTITYNRIAGSDRMGIIASAGSVDNNLITWTHVDGLRAGTASTRNNTFINNYGNGLYLNAIPAAFSGNNFEFNAGTYDVYVSVPKTTIINLDAQNNWWGTTDNNIIKQRTYDYFDDYNLAKLITLPVLTTPSQTAPAYVRSVALDPPSPVGIQTVNFTVEFSRPMEVTDFPEMSAVRTNANSWSYKNPMPNPCAERKNTVYATNGKVYVIGGSDLAGQVAEYDPLTDIWILKNGAPEYEFQTMAAATNGKIYAMKGTLLEEYDPLTNSWMAKSNPPVSLYNSLGASNGKVYAMWGSMLQEYNPYTDTWTRKSDAPFSPEVSAIVDNNIYTMKSYGAGSFLAEYNILTDTWVRKADWSVARYHYELIGAMNGKIYAIAGTTPCDSDDCGWMDYPNNDVYEYLPLTDTWKQQAGISTWTDNSGIVATNNHKILVMGGNDEWNMIRYVSVQEFTLPDFGYSNINLNPEWIDSNHFQANYDITSLNPRGEYRLTIKPNFDTDGMPVLPDSRTTFSVDYAGEISDTTPPEAPLVSAWGNGSLTQLTAQASASDPDSEIVGYRYAIGSTPGGSDVVNWTNTPYTEVTRSGLILQADQAYYVSFQARNLGGLWSPFGVSNAVVNGSMPNPAPMLTSLDPNSAIAGASAFTLTVTGTNFINGSVVRWNGSDRTTAFISDTQLTAVVTAADIATAGGYPVTVFTPAPGGGTSNVLNFTVVPPNALPVALNDNYNTNEDTELTIAAPGVLDNDTDADSDPLTAVQVTSPTHGALTLNPNGSFTYVPTADWNGSDSFTYKANDGTVDSNTATVTLNVTAVNDVPVANAQSVSTAEDTAKAITLTATDPDDTSFTWTIVTAPANGNLSGVAPDVTYTPAANYDGADSFTFKVNDGDEDSNIATVSINVTAVNDVPIANAQSVSTPEDTAKAITLTATDLDDTTFTWTIVTPPAHGTLSGTTPNVTYTPAANYNGGDSFTFKVNDGNVDSNIATVSINVTAVNDVPVANAQSVSTTEDTDKAVTLTATDPDDTSFTWSIVTAPTHGALSGTAPNVTYTPAANYNGADSFTFKVNDGDVDSNVATVTLTVTSLNDPPVAVDDNYTTDEDTELTIAAPGVLGNDTDADNDPLTAILITSPAHGTLTLNTDGSFTYTPEVNWNATDSFIYKTNDGTADSNIAAVNITIIAVNDAPVLEAIGDKAVNELALLTFTAQATDVDNTVLVYSLVDAPTGAVIGTATGVFTWTPAEVQDGDHSFTVQVCDDDTPAICDSEEITVTVNEVNSVSVAVDDSFSMDEDTGLSITAPGVLGNDTDADSNPLTAVLITGPAHGTLTLNADGGFTYTPDANWYGRETFIYMANDGIADSNIATVTITVADVPEMSYIYMPLIYR